RPRATTRPSSAPAWRRRRSTTAPTPRPTLSRRGPPRWRRRAGSKAGRNDPRSPSLLVQQFLHPRSGAFGVAGVERADHLAVLADQHRRRVAEDAVLPRRAADRLADALARGQRHGERQVLPLPQFLLEP